MAHFRGETSNEPLGAFGDAIHGYLSAIAKDIAPAKRPALAALLEKFAREIESVRSGPTASDGTPTTGRVELVAAVRELVASLPRCWGSRTPNASRYAENNWLRDCDQPATRGEHPGLCEKHYLALPEELRECFEWETQDALVKVLALLDATMAPAVPLSSDRPCQCGHGLAEHGSVSMTGMSVCGGPACLCSRFRPEVP